MRGLIAGIILALAALVVDAIPADAHNYDSYSLWYCAWSRPSSSYTIVHSVPDYLTPTHVRYYCGAVVGTIAYQWWVWRDLASGSWMYGSEIMDCRYYYCHEPG